MNKKYTKILIQSILCFCAANALHAQVGINVANQSPSVNAILDLNTGNPNNLGLLLPNVSLNTTLTTFGMNNAATPGDVGMMVYNTNALAGSGVGIYYWNGTTWVDASQITTGGSGNVTSCGGASTGFIPYFTNSAGTNVCTSPIFQGGTGIIGVGTTTPVDALDIYGASAIGTTYAGTLAPTNGLIVQGQVGIGTSAPDASAQLDVTSSSQGLLIPRLATAPTTPATSLIYYNTTTQCFMFYTGTGWEAMACSCLGAPTTPGSITGSTTICSGTTGNTYSISSVTGATSYIWSIPASVGTITSGQGTGTVTLTSASVTSSGTMSVVAINGCGMSAASTASITVESTPSSAITQTNTFSSAYACPGTTATFSVAASTTDETYAWTISSASCGAITGSSTSNTVTVTAGAGAAGTLTCVETNPCGSSTQTFSLNTSTSHGSETFAYTGGLQYWVVPSCVTTITIVATGGAGSDADWPGGAAAQVTAIETVVAGDTLMVAVGGESANSFYGGGGGGASFVWDNSINIAADYPLVAAGGGGGSGGNEEYGGLPASATTTPNTDATNMGTVGSNGGAGGVGGGTYGGGPGAGWFTTTGVTPTTNIGGGGYGAKYGFFGGIANFNGNSTNNGSLGGFGGGGGGGGSGNGSNWGGGGGGGGFNGGPGGNSSNGQATEYGGGGGGSGYYVGGYPYGTSTDFVGGSTTTGNVIVNMSVSTAYNCWCTTNNYNGSVIISW